MEARYPLFPTPPGDWRTDVFALQSIRMAAIYNIMIRTINSIIHHAYTINETDIPGFMSYCCNLAIFIRYHAMIEDFMFLFLEMSFTKKQGALVPEAMNLKDMGTWVNFCTDVRKNSAKYNPGDLVGPLKQFADPMLTHMKRTMPLLDAALLKQYIQPDMLKSFETQLEAKNENDCLPFSAAPLLMVNSDCTHNSWFPPVPSPVVMALRYVVIPLNSGTWKFSQCDTYMRPKEVREPYRGKDAVNTNTLLQAAIGLLGLGFLHTLWKVLKHSTAL